MNKFILISIVTIASDVLTSRRFEVAALSRGAVQQRLSNQERLYQLSNLIEARQEQSNEERVERGSLVQKNETSSQEGKSELQQSVDRKQETQPATQEKQEQQKASSKQEEKPKSLNDITQATDDQLFGDIDSQPLNSPNDQKRMKYVHIIPHSHTDLGWQGTIKDYFQGQNLEFYIGSVNSILTTVMQELTRDQNRTFSYAEMEFFKMWWDRQNDLQRAQVRRLIQNGQFQIVNGGISAPDEATTNADDIIDNFMRGHQFLSQELGVEDPNISWQLDSFGVSKGYARLARDLGFDALFFTRVDTEEKIKLQQNKEKVQVWRADESNFGSKKDVLSIVMAQESGNYCWPKGFAFDQNYHDYIDFEEKNNKNYNGKEKMDHLKKVVNRMIESERGDHIFITYGCDFAFTQAQINYFFMDAVIKHWNQENPNIQMFYSTPQRYLNEIKKMNDDYKSKNIKSFEQLNQNELNQSSAQSNQSDKAIQQSQSDSKVAANLSDHSEGFTIRRDDSFPYAQRKNQYWSGFFTSRPQLKKLLRTTSSHFHASLAQSSMQALKQNNVEYSDYVVEQQQSIMEKIGTLQHHDSITGTGLKKVSEDYFVKAVDTLKDVEQMNSRILSHELTNKGIEIKKLDQSIMLHQVFKDKFYSPYQLSNQFIVVAQNPSFSQTTQLIKIDCPYNKYGLYQVDLNDRSLQKIDHDNFRSKALINGNQEAITFKNEIQFPVSFASFETRKIFMILKEKDAKVQQKPAEGIESKLNELNKVSVDKSVSEMSNFKQVIPGDFLSYGDKQLYFRGLLLLKPTDEAVKDQEKKTGKKLSLDEEYAERACSFELIDTKQNISQRFVMSPRFYQSNESRSTGDGIYEFQPKKQYTQPYSAFKSIEMSTGQFSGQFLLTYESDDMAEQKGTTSNPKLTTTIELSHLSDFLKFSVNMNEIPISNVSEQLSDDSLLQLNQDLSGKNVVINWEFLDDFNTNGDLWYDANGLEMVHKQLWKRQEFNFTQTDNIASNFYPIQSAIAVRDKNSNKQVTIMTDRAMAGSAGLRGQRNIELMQNRRVIGYDADGVSQSLDDRDNFNNGIEVKATYYMQVFDRMKSSANGTSLSKQRQQQLALEQPILLMYSKDFKLDQQFTIKNSFLNLSQSNATALSNEQNKAILKNITGQEDQSTLKFLVYATNKSEILVRMTNMEDNFDVNNNDKQKTRTYTVDLKQLAETLYERANGQSLNGNSSSEVKLSIEETTLTGVSSYKKKMLESTEWQTKEPLKQAFESWQTLQQQMLQDAEDQIKLDAQNHPQIYKVNLEAQRIRAFKISFKK